MFGALLSAPPNQTEATDLQHRQFSPPFLIAELLTMPDLEGSEKKRYPTISRAPHATLWEHVHSDFAIHRFARSACSTCNVWGKFIQSGGRPIAPGGVGRRPGSWAIRSAREGQVAPQHSLAGAAGGRIASADFAETCASWEIRPVPRGPYTGTGGGASALHARGDDRTRRSG